MLIPAYYDAPDTLKGSVPMRGDDPRNDSMFSVTPEARVRPDHPPRPIRRMTRGAHALVAAVRPVVFEHWPAVDFSQQTAARAAAADALQHSQRAPADGGVRLQRPVPVVRHFELG